MSAAYERLWTVEEPGVQRRPAEVIWEAESAAELLATATTLGYVVRGPYVLEPKGDVRPVPKRGA